MSAAPRALALAPRIARPGALAPRIARLAAAAALLLAGTAPLHAQRADLPPEPAVIAALDNHPAVAAALARVEAARAGATMLARGTHEVTVTGSYVRRTVDREGDFNEFDATVTRAFRLPGKAALDARAGALGVEVAENQMEDARHQVALRLADLWHEWLAAGSLYRSDAEAVAALDQALAAIRRRVALRDAAPLDVDQAMAALDGARAQAEASLAAREAARAAIAANFPDLPLPAEPPELPVPALPAQDLAALRDQVVIRSHEIRAADREAQRLGVVARRTAADRLADPSFGVRLFSERGGMERGAGLVASIPLGGGHRRAAAERASAEANAARLELAVVQRGVNAVADTDLANARNRIAAWRRAEAAVTSADAAVARVARGHALGQIDLAELLYARRQATEARRAEIAARVESDRALLRLQIDAHVIWIGVEKHDHDAD